MKNDRYFTMFCSVCWMYGIFGIYTLSHPETPGFSHRMPVTVLMRHKNKHTLLLWYMFMLTVACCVDVLNNPKFCPRLRNQIRIRGRDNNINVRLPIMNVSFYCNRKFVIYNWPHTYPGLDTKACPSSGLSGDIYQHLITNSNKGLLCSYIPVRQHCLYSGM